MSAPKYHIRQFERVSPSSVVARFAWKGDSLLRGLFEAWRLMRSGSIQVSLHRSENYAAQSQTDQK